MIWIYGICDRPELPAPHRAGLAHAPLEGLREGALLAVFSRHAQAVGDPAPDVLWAHERVVERLMSDRTVLPVRFGSTVDDDAALRRFLAERQQALLATLARISGRVELGVRVLELVREDDRVPVGAPPPTGRDYLLGKLLDGRVASSLHASLAALAADARTQTTRSADEVLRTAYLVDRVAVPRFRAAVERLQHDHPAVAILCTGPWPPYSFAEAPA